MDERRTNGSRRRAARGGRRAALERRAHRAPRRLRVLERWRGLRLAEIIEVLDVGPSEAICSLVVAVKEGADAVEDWLVEHEVPEIH